MPLALTDEQTALTAAVAGFIDRHAPRTATRPLFDAWACGERPAFWNALVAQGFHAVHLPETVGGGGGGLVEAACVLDAAGHALLPGPLLQTVIAGAVVATSQPSTARDEFLEDIAAGTRVAVVALEAGQLSASVCDGGWILSGVVGPEIGLCGAERIICSARTDTGELRWFALHSSQSGIRLDRDASTDLTRDVGTIHLDQLRASHEQILDGIDAHQSRLVAVSLIAAEAAGIARWCVDNVVAYLKVREQFGRRIGSFQSLQHKAARLFIDSELTVAAAWDAVRAGAQPSLQHQIAVTGAAIMAVSRLPELVIDAMTMFGAIGYTWEHDLHLYWKRAISLAAAVGPAAQWAHQLGEPGNPGRDLGIEMSDTEPEFRAHIAATLDTAAALHNDAAGRQNPEYPQFRTGPQRTALADAGLVAPHLYVPWGVNASPAQQLIIEEEFDKRPYLVRPSLGIGQWILPTVLTAGSEEQRRRFAQPTLRGEMTWCQLFSEPGAGSDLASLKTTATRVEGGWRINGQKVWTSLAQRADWGALLARTDPAAAKHKGIGYFLLDMCTPGITIRPLRTASGDEHFNEVFLDDVFIPDDMLVGEPNAGWSHALATMANERVAIGAYVKLDKEAELRALAAQPRPDQWAVRQALGEIRAESNAIGALAVRDTLSRLAGREPGPASSVAKVATALFVRRVTAHALQFSGRSALVSDADQAAVAQSLLMPAELIGGGTVEIQLNIIATLVLGLPRS